MGEIRKRGRIWWIRYCRDGRRYEESARSDKYEAARDLLRVREGEIAKGAPVTSAIGRFTFADAAKDIETDYVVNHRRSLGHLTRRLRLHLTPYFGGRRMASITKTDVVTYIRRRSDAGASAGEINRELAILKRMFTLAVHAGKLLAKPHIPALAEASPRSGFFERDEFEQVRSHLPAPLQPLVTFAYLTGWRIPSEVLPLQWRQVDLKAGTVRLDPGTTKNKLGRLFPFAHLPELRHVLKEQRRVTTRVDRARGIICRWVFHRNGKRIKDFREAWVQACTAADVPDRIPHDFRRTAVRNLERAGVSRSVAMQLTGHLTESVYRRYAIVSEQDLSDGVGKLAGLADGTIAGTKRRAGQVKRFRRKT